MNKFSYQVTCCCESSGRLYVYWELRSFTSKWGSCISCGFIQTNLCGETNRRRRFFFNKLHVWDAALPCESRFRFEFRIQVIRWRPIFVRCCRFAFARGYEAWILRRYRHKKILLTLMSSEWNRTEKRESKYCWRSSWGKWKMDKVHGHEVGTNWEWWKAFFFISATLLLHLLRPIHDILEESSEIKGRATMLLYLHVWQSNFLSSLRKRKPKSKSFSFLSSDGAWRGEGKKANILIAACRSMSRWTILAVDSHTLRLMAIVHGKSRRENIVAEAREFVRGRLRKGLFGKAIYRENSPILPPQFSSLSWLKL